MTLLMSGIYNPPKMTKGIIKLQLSQLGYENIDITIMENTQLVLFRQGSNTIFLRFPYIEEFCYITSQLKKWTKPKKR